MRSSSLFTNSDESVNHRRETPNAPTPNDGKRSRINPEQFHKKSTKKLPYQTLDQTRSSKTHSTPAGPIFKGGTIRDGDFFKIPSLLQFMPLPILLLNCFKRDTSVTPPSFTAQSPLAPPPPRRISIVHLTL